MPTTHAISRLGRPARVHRVPTPASAVPYLTVLRRIVARVREHYLAKIPADAIRADDARRTPAGIVYPTPQARAKARALGRPIPRPLYNVAPDLARAAPRVVRAHGLSVPVDAFVQPDELGPVLDGIGASVGAHADREFSALLQDGARAAGGFRPGVREIALEDVAPGFVEPFRRRNLDLITAMVEGQVSDLETILRENAGLNGTELQALIVQRCGVTERHAALLAHDQTLKLSANVAQLRAENVGATKYVWITSSDERVRGRPGGKWARSQSDHWALNGKSFSYGHAPVTNPVTGATNNPGEDYRCRCTAAPDLSHIFGEEPWDGRSETAQDGPEAPTPRTFGGVARADIPHDPVAHETHAFGGLDLGAPDSESSGIVRNVLDTPAPVVQSPVMNPADEIQARLTEIRARQNAAQKALNEANDLPRGNSRQRLAANAAAETAQKELWAADKAQRDARAELDALAPWVDPLTPAERAAQEARIADETVELNARVRATYLETDPTRGGDPLAHTEGSDDVRAGEAKVSPAPTVQSLVMSETTIPEVPALSPREARAAAKAADIEAGYTPGQARFRALRRDKISDLERSVAEGEALIAAHPSMTLGEAEALGRPQIQTIQREIEELRRTLTAMAPGAA